MTLIELRYIVTLADELHIGRTAALCHVSQPALSIALRKLEEELGLVLFERGNRHIRVSDAGAPIIAQARQVLQQVAGMKALAEAGQDQLLGPLRLGTLTTLGPYMLPQLMAYLRQTCPQMPLYVQEDCAARLRQRLRASEVDAILVTQPFREPETVTQALFDEPLLVLLPRSHPLAARAQLGVGDLQAQPLLLMAEGHCLRDQVLALCPWAAQQPPWVQANSLDMLRYSVAAGQGIAIVPASASDPLLCQAHRLQALPLQGAQRSLALVWRNGYPRYRAIDALRRAIQTCSSSYWGFSARQESLAPEPQWAGWMQ